MSGAVLRVSELFGPTFQGEGPSSGQRALFVRLTGCPLACSWCDTPYTWDSSRFDLRAESRTVPVEEIRAWVADWPGELVVVTGGEPLIQQASLATLTRMLVSDGRRVEIETSGTIAPRAVLSETVALFVVSPKLANSGLPTARRLRPAALDALAATGRSVFKFVACNPGDLSEAAAVAKDYPSTPVWVMPQGTTEQEVRDGLRALAGPVLDQGWHLSDRLHVNLWGDVRGR